MQVSDLCSVFVFESLRDEYRMLLAEHRFSMFSGLQDAT